MGVASLFYPDEKSKFLAIKFFSWWHDRVLVEVGLLSRK